MQPYAHLGTGFGFPFRITDDGDVASASGLDSVSQNLLNLILTQTLDMPGNRRFGASVADLVYDHPDIAAALIPSAVGQAFARNFNRGQLIGVRMRKEGTTMFVTVTWRDTQTGTTTTAEAAVSG